jgi:uncharacterized protein YjbI with pentapeptide repeats
LREDSLVALRRIQRLWPLWVVLAAVLAVMLVLFLPPLLIAPYGLKDPEKRLPAENALRTTLAGTLGGMAVIAGAVVGALNFRETGRQNRAVMELARDQFVESQVRAQEQVELQRRGQVTERFSKAIEQLGQSGAEKVDIRIGAVYALEQIAQDSPELHWPIMEVFTACLREHARLTKTIDGTGESTDAPLPSDHQAIATVIGRRRQEQDRPKQRLDLHEVDLSGVVWKKAQLEGAYLALAQLEGANLVEAQLKGANLVGAQLGGAYLDEAQLEGAYLPEAQLEGAYLDHAQLKGAHLDHAQLKGAYLVGAQLEGANLVNAQLVGAHLKGADLSGANIAGADLTDAEGLTWGQLQAARNWDQAKLPAYLDAQRAEQAGPGTIAVPEDPKLDAAGGEQGSADNSGKTQGRRY